MPDSRGRVTAEEVRRARERWQQMLGASYPPAPIPAGVNWNEIVSQFTTSLQRQVGTNELPSIWQAGDPPIVNIDPEPEVAVPNRQSGRPAVGAIIGYIIDHAFHCRACTWNRIRCNNDGSPRTPAIYRGGDQRAVLTPIAFTEGPSADRQCNYCGIQVETNGEPGETQNWHPQWGWMLLRNCNHCHTDLPQIGDHFARSSATGRWSRNCRNCNQRIREQDILAGRRRLRRTVQPLGRPRMFGVEIEFIGDQHLVSGHMNDRGLTCRISEYTHEIRAGRWKIVHDSSLNAERGYCGELVSPPLTADAAGVDAVMTASDALSASMVEVDTSCGLHVHHEAGDMDPPSFARLFRFYYNHQAAIDRLVEPHRQVLNEDAGPLEYSEPLRDGIVEQIENLRARPRDQLRNLLGDVMGRYYVVNPNSYTRYGTIEFRQHHGTINSAEILPWAEFTRSIVDWSNTDARPLDRDADLPAIVHMLEEHGLPQASSAVLLGRGGGVVPRYV